MRAVQWERMFPHELEAAFDQLEAEEGVGAIVLTLSLIHI